MTSIFIHLYKTPYFLMSIAVDSLWLYITISSVVLVVLLVVLISYWCCYKRQRSARANSINRQFSGPGNKVRQNESYVCTIRSFNGLYIGSVKKCIIMLCSVLVTNLCQDTAVTLLFSCSC
jgi:hypothetical protein